MERYNYLTIELAQNLIIFIQSVEYQAAILRFRVWNPSPNHLGKDRVRLKVLCV